MVQVTFEIPEHQLGNFCIAVGATLKRWGRDHYGGGGAPARSRKPGGCLPALADSKRNRHDRCDTARW